MNFVSILLFMILFGSIPLLVLYKFSISLKRHRFPFSDLLLRPAGYSVGKKLDGYVMDLILYLVASIFFGVFGSFFIFGSNIVSVGIGVGFITSELFIVYKSHKLLRDKIFPYNLGYAGELAVGQSLNQLMLDGYHVYHDLEAEEKFNIDHIIVGKNGVFAVETKAKTKPKLSDKSKQFKVMYDGKALFFEDNPNYASTDFLEQTVKQANWLRKELSSSTGESTLVTPVLAIPGWYVEYKVNQTNAEVKVFNHNLLDSIKTLNTGLHLSEQRISQIIHQLKQKCGDLDMNRGRWGE